MANQVYANGREISCKEVMLKDKFRTLGFPSP